MAYNKEVDEKVFSEETIVGEDTLSVEVFRYNGNEPKVQIGRKKDERHLKLGRLNLEEINAILPLIEKAKGVISPSIQEEEAEEEEEAQECVMESKMEEAQTETEVKQETQAEFRIVLAEPSLLVNAIANIKQKISEIPIRITKDKLEIVCMDPANVTMVVFELLSGCCTEWDVKQEGLIVVNTNIFYEILREANKTDIIKLSRDGLKLKIELIGNMKRDYTIPTLEWEEKEQKVPSLDFKAKVRMSTANLYEQIKGADKVAESVVFDADKDKLVIRAEGDISKFEVVNKGDDVKVNGKAVSKYSLEYLKSISNAKKVSEEVLLEFGTDYPLSVTYAQVDKFKLRWILAPRVNND